MLDKSCHACILYTIVRSGPGYADFASLETQSVGSLRGHQTQGFLLYKQVILRLRSLFVKTDWVYHVWCNFYPDNTGWKTVIFETLKDDNLLIKNLA